jgi:hypothetical protein
MWPGVQNQNCSRVGEAAVQSLEAAAVWGVGHTGLIWQGVGCGILLFDFSTQPCLNSDYVLVCQK